MPRWWKIPSWKRSTNRFRCWIEVAGREEKLERPVEEAAAPPPKDPFNEIDFGSYFQEYLDPGYRTQPEYEESEKPSFENFPLPADDSVRSPGVATGSSDPGAGAA